MGFIGAATKVGKRSKETAIMDWAQKALEKGDKIEYTAEFTLKLADFGRPGAILIRNTHQAEFYLDNITLELPSGPVHFPCHSYVASSILDSKPRVFFTNQVIKPSKHGQFFTLLRSVEMQ